MVKQNKLFFRLNAFGNVVYHMEPLFPGLCASYKQNGRHFPDDILKYTMPKNGLWENMLATPILDIQIHVLSLDALQLWDKAFSMLDISSVSGYDHIKKKLIDYLRVNIRYWMRSSIIDTTETTSSQSPATPPPATDMATKLFHSLLAHPFTTDKSNVVSDFWKSVEIIVRWIPTELQVTIIRCRWGLLP